MLTTARACRITSDLAGYADLSLKAARSAWPDLPPDAFDMLRRMGDLTSGIARGVDEALLYVIDTDVLRLALDVLLTTGVLPEWLDLVPRHATYLWDGADLAGEAAIVYVAPPDDGAGEPPCVVPWGWYVEEDGGAMPDVMPVAWADADVARELVMPDPVRDALAARPRWAMVTNPTIAGTMPEGGDADVAAGRSAIEAAVDVVCATLGARHDSDAVWRGVPLALLACVFALMGHPELVTTGRHAVGLPKPKRSVRRRLESQGITPRSGRAVTTVSLREPTTAHAASHAASGRTYGCRWIVHGHVRMQPCGPHNSERKVVWVAPYLKGPAGAPLKRDGGRLVRLTL